MNRSDRHKQLDYGIPVGPQQMYSKIVVNSKIEVVFEVKLLVPAKLEFQKPKSRIIPKLGFYYSMRD